MKYIYFGTPEFAATILKDLIASGHPPVAVVTNPDKPTGRKQIITPSPVKILALENNIKVLTPESLKLEQSENDLKEIDADIYILAAYGKIIPSAVLEIPKNGVICVHPSLLPKFRGATPVQNAILHGLKETGVTLFQMDKEIDHGPILLQEKTEIKPNENTESLLNRLAGLSASMCANLLDNFSKFEPIVQNHEEASYTRKIETSDAYLDPMDLKRAQEGNAFVAEILNNKIHAFCPEPGAWTMEGEKRVKLLDSEIIDGKLKIKVKQVEGKTPQVV